VQSFVFAAVLFAAACHAGWNALVKVGLDPLSTTILIAVGAAVVSLVGLPFVGLPARAAWPWLIASVLVHVFYFAALAESYRTGDLGQVYPIARGSAPLMTATGSALLIGEQLSLFGWAGIAVLAAGVLLLSARGGRIVQLERRAVGYALFTGLTVCAYSLIDGMGARLSQNPQAYVAWVFVANAIVLLAYGMWRNAAGMTLALRRFWLRGLAGGALQALSYGIVLWAMTLAPIAIVAGLRETSVLFGALIAVLVLKEPFGAARMLAATLIVCGLVLIRLQ
jgi:drug/metabolite transporter (DMT)-like permease